MSLANSVTRGRKTKVNSIGLDKSAYRGRPSTMCSGCGHDSISSQIIRAAFELGLKSETIIKLSGIGCSSKSPAYFLNRAFGFNAVHGRMPSVATGAVLANRALCAIGISGDGDTGNIGLGQFKHLIRRNTPMVYVVENNGVYGLTKGQSSATADRGQAAKYYPRNELPPIDLCFEAIIGGCGFVARSFAGDSKQVLSLLKAAFNYDGTALLDLISPCVTFNNLPESSKSYDWVRDNAVPLHDISYVPPREELSVDYDPGETTTVELHDGSLIMLKKLDQDYDPEDRAAAVKLLEASSSDEALITGLLYYNPELPNVMKMENLVDIPLAHLPVEDLRPSPESLKSIMDGMRP